MKITVDPFRNAEENLIGALNPILVNLLCYLVILVNLLCYLVILVNLHRCEREEVLLFNQPLILPLLSHIFATTYQMYSDMVSNSKFGPILYNCEKGEIVNTYPPG